MPKVLQWSAAAEALGALGAHLTLLQTGEKAPPDVAEALRAVLEAAGLSGVDDLLPQQRAMVASLAKLAVHQADELLEAPGRSAGWSFTDPVILDGWGRGSMMVPPGIKAAHPDLADVKTFLDVGTGVGLLALSATSVWPSTTVVGIDIWEPSLERARAIVVFHEAMGAKLGQELPAVRDKIRAIGQSVQCEEERFDLRARLGIGRETFLFFIPAGVRRAPVPARMEWERASRRRPEPATRERRRGNARPVCRP